VTVDAGVLGASIGDNVVPDRARLLHPGPQRDEGRAPGHDLHQPLRGRPRSDHPGDQRDDLRRPLAGLDERRRRHRRGRDAPHPVDQLPRLEARGSAARRRVVQLRGRQRPQPRQPRDDARRCRRGRPARRGPFLLGCGRPHDLAGSAIRVLSSATCSTRSCREDHPVRGRQCLDHRLAVGRGDPRVTPGYRAGVRPARPAQPRQPRMAGVAPTISAASCRQGWTTQANIPAILAAFKGASDHCSTLFDRLRQDNGVLPSREASTTTPRRREIVYAVMGVWQAANPLVGIALAGYCRRARRLPSLRVHRPPPRLLVEGDRGRTECSPVPSPSSTPPSIGLERTSPSRVEAARMGQFSPPGKEGHRAYQSWRRKVDRNAGTSTGWRARRWSGRS
jgi:hypothetical protein